MSQLTRYRHPVYDSARWEGFRFREGDIVISTPPKCGTTWMQTLCAMLVLDTVDFDRPLAEISPWLDMQSNRLATVVRGLEAQQHRRLIKTHTPLDGLPYDDRVTYLCVGRDPRDVALSFEHHLANLDMDAFMAARAAAVGLDDLADFGPPPGPPTGDPAERFWAWVYDDTGAAMGPTLAAILHHLATFWALRDHDNVALFHYSDLLADLPGQLHALSDTLQIPITDARLQAVRRRRHLRPHEGARRRPRSRRRQPHLAQQPRLLPPRPKRSVDRPARRRRPTPVPPAGRRPRTRRPRHLGTQRLGRRQHQHLEAAGEHC